ncbi:class I SAM-dependent methyltransferase [soil metagenome]
MNSVQHCCLCGGEDLFPLFKLDQLPISHYLRKKLDDPDPRFSVGFECCQACGLLQIADAIPADLLYGHADTYTTGFQRPKHLEDLITTAVARQDPGRAIDIGCNDGALLEALGRAGYKETVGVEPNAVAAAIARDKGHNVYTSYLDKDSAARIVAEHGEFDTAYVRHVVEHVSDLGQFFACIRTVLRPEGVLVVELPEVEEGFELGSPAILWEEHVNYFTAALAEYMLGHFGFRVLDRRRYVFGGGSLAFVARKEALPPAGARADLPDSALAMETLRGFVKKMECQKNEMRELVSQARSQGYQIVMYGAAPRSCLLASACEIADMIDFVVDDRPDIQARIMPGTQQFILPLAEVAGKAGGKLLCLLGVGSENEFKVRAKLEAATDASLAFVSLFPPRDTLDSIEMARRTIAAHK